MSDSERAISARPASPPGTPRASVPAPPGDALAARPFVKWAGGKTQLLDALVERAPREIDTYYEPFLGGGAMFFRLASDPELAPRRTVLNDLNHHLVTVYQVVRDQVEPLVEALAGVAEPYLAADDEERARLFYAQRSRQPEGPVDLAARFIFLNKTCFNGLYRVNRKGEFNVPHGRYRSPRILDEQGLRDAAAALRDVEVTCEDFEVALRGAQAGDFVYLDPPFEPLSKTSSFTGYTEGAFDRTEQRRLKWAVDDLTGRGVCTMLSNSAQDYILGLYSADRGTLEGARYRHDTIPARRAINSRGDRRGAIDELIVLNYSLEQERRSLTSSAR